MEKFFTIIEWALAGTFLAITVHILTMNRYENGIIGHPDGDAAMIIGDGCTINLPATEEHLRNRIAWCVLKNSGWYKIHKQSAPACEFSGLQFPGGCQFSVCGDNIADKVVEICK